MGAWGNFKMRTLVNNPNEISTYQAELEKVLTSNLNPVGSSRYSNGTIWYDPRNKARASNPTKLPNYFFPNYFGLGDHNDTQVVEVNITGNANGAFVHNTTNNDIELVHLGIQPRLLDWYRKNSPKNVITVSNNGKKTDVILIGSFYSLNSNVTISSVDFIDKLTTFIQNVKKFKDENPQTKPNDKINDGEEDMPSNTQKLSLNTILYGPPGTGKTYNTINKALEIVDSTVLTKQPSDNNDEAYRKRLKQSFDSFLNSGRIRFVTFHQSYSYEEFVEGIRAETVDEQIRYEIKPGVFKKICEDAQIPSQIKGFDGVGDNPRIWKISICSASQNPTKDYCYQNGEARIGWGHVGDLNLEVNLDDPSFKIGLNDKSTLTNFSKDMAIGDILLSIKSNTHVEAIGVITSDYYYDNHQLTGIPSDYCHVRKVNWLFTDQSYDISKLNNNYRLTQKTVYELSRISWSKLAMDLHNLGYAPFNVATSKKPFVLIIDEINRGNISKIFGELITLIEDSKRAGKDEKLSVTLPYSNESFSVPNNLYIIGTMNTADRSLALMDTALRRRFEFIEMMPVPKLLENVKEIITEKGTNGQQDTKVSIDIQKILETMNQRIEVLYDREHTLGHAFFMSLIDNPTIENLAGIFKNKIIPLLQEYFFEDWEKIRIVLGDDQKPKDKGYAFVTKKEIEKNLFSAGAIKDNRLEKKLSRYSFNESALGKPEAYIGIYPEIGTGQKIPDDGQQDTNNG